MQGLRVIVVCNLKPAKMREVMSYGMVRKLVISPFMIGLPIFVPVYTGIPSPPLPENNTSPLNPPMQVLCASNDSHDVVDPIVPPEGVPNGERITFEGWVSFY